MLFIFLLTIALFSVSMFRVESGFDIRDPSGMFMGIRINKCGAGLATFLWNCVALTAGE